MKWIIALIIFFTAIICVGLLLPKKYRVSISACFSVDADKLWAAITDFGAYPTWRSGIIGVQHMPDMNGHPVWKEINFNREGIAYETLESVPGKHLVRRIADPALPFGGTWEFNLETTSDGTNLTITENGEVYNPVFRILSRYIIGHTQNIQAYLNDLQTKVGTKHIAKNSSSFYSKS